MLHFTTQQHTYSKTGGGMAVLTAQWVVQVMWTMTNAFYVQAPHTVSLRHYSKKCSLPKAVYLTIPFQYWQTAKEGTHPLDRQVPALTVQTWKIMPSLKHAAWSAGDSYIETCGLDSYEVILKLNYHLTLLNAELNNRKLTTNENQISRFAMSIIVQRDATIYSYILQTTVHVSDDTLNHHQGHTQSVITTYGTGRTYLVLSVDMEESEQFRFLHVSRQ